MPSSALSLLAPGGGGLKWFLDHPEQVDLAIAELIKMRQMTARLVTCTGPNNAGITFQDGGSNLLLPLPFQFANKIVAPTGGVTIDANARAAFAALLAELTRVGFNPSS